MSTFDRAKALKIASRLEAKPNPPVDEVAAAKITELFETLHREGVQQSSLRESDVRRFCAQLGLSDAQTQEALEEHASWGETDDV